MTGQQIKIPLGHDTETITFAGKWPSTKCGHIVTNLKGVDLWGHEGRWRGVGFEHGLDSTSRRPEERRWRQDSGRKLSCEEMVLDPRRASKDMTSGNDLHLSYLIRTIFYDLVLSYNNGSKNGCL